MSPFVTVIIYQRQKPRAGRIPHSFQQTPRGPLGTYNHRQLCTPPRLSINKFNPDGEILLYICSHYYMLDYYIDLHALVISLNEVFGDIMVLASPPRPPVDQTT